MLKLTDLRKTTRRGKDGMRVVYPRFLRDASLAPRIEMAIRYMERMLGQPRRALDDEVIIQLFGDHKVARCLVACLGAHYRHRPRAFTEVMPPDVVAALAARGIASASDLRLWLFRRVNRALAGFAGGEERAGFLAEAERELGLATGQMDALIALDAPEQAILVRSGPKPSAEDVITRYNYAVAGAVLAQSSQVRVNLGRTLSQRDADMVRALAQRLGVSIELGGRELVLHGRQDALESWIRHGAKLVRLLAMLLLCGLPARGGEALVVAPQGGEWLFRLDSDILGYLGATTPQLDLMTLCASHDLLEKLLADAAALRRAGSLDGWVVRRVNEPLVAGGRLTLALGQCVRGDERVALLALPTTGAVAGVAALAGQTPLIALRADEASAAEDADGDRFPDVLRYSSREDLLALPDMLAQAMSAAAQRMDVAQVETICEETSTAGVLTEPVLAQRLGCAEEEIAQRLAEPPTRAACERRGLEYIEGFGLCTREMLGRVRRAASDMREMRDNPQVGSAWMMRTLGRRLREVTGAHEGIECLIAWLGAA
ncbi:MAG TPA: DUF790 family protein [Ktedonobacterales bacterium]|nr:DUF790 family protein [Ktedonobacterales bacterium]